MPSAHLAELAPRRLHDALCFRSNLGYVSAVSLGTSTTTSFRCDSQALLQVHCPQLLGTLRREIDVLLYGFFGTVKAMAGDLSPQ
jgi:hypothetical protein